MGDNITYYQRNKERLQETHKIFNVKMVVRNKQRNMTINKDCKSMTKYKYIELPNEERDTKREYGRKRYRNMSEEDKQEVKVCKKICCTLTKLLYIKLILFCIYKI